MDTLGQLAQAKGNERVVIKKQPERLIDQNPRQAPPL